ncbi:unnamed protein product, partial [Anisakis simplex]|uniref:Uncharacterized protein n=1 Tax=Anisakis simplex TaxID=6269 RepID=A0A0M3KKR7_ANISI
MFSRINVATGYPTYTLDTPFDCTKIPVTTNQHGREKSNLPLACP